MAQTGIELAAVLEDNHQSQQQEINNIQMTKQTGEQLASIDEQKPLSTHLQQQINIPISSHANVNIRPPQPKLPSSDLLNGSRENYLKIGVPLYGASIKCDWKAAKAIFDKYPDMKLERCSITENGETALHVASSAKGSKVEEFVKNLVAKMERNDLELQNNNHNTALYLAAAAGNIKAVKIMFDKNNTLLTIAGSNEKMMPLYTAVLFGNVDMVKYLYNHSKELRDDGWTPTNRGWLLEKCVENDMFDLERDGEDEVWSFYLLYRRTSTQIQPGSVHVSSLAPSVGPATNHISSFSTQTFRSAFFVTMETFSRYTTSRSKKP